MLDALALGPRYYVELLAVLPYVEYRTLVRVIGELDEAGLVGRDDQGRLIRLAGAR